MGESEITLKGGESRIVAYTISLPEVLPTENLDSKIIAEDFAETEIEDGTAVAARLAVATQISIRFLSPPKISESSVESQGEGAIEVTDIQTAPLIVSGDSAVNVAVTNNGGVQQTIIAEIIVYDSANNEVLRTASTRYLLAPKSRTRIRINLDASALPAGTYNAKVVVKAGAQVIEKEIRFTTRAARPRALEEKTTGQTTTIALIVILVLLVIFSIAMFFRKRRKGRIQRV